MKILIILALSTLNMGATYAAESIKDGKQQILKFMDSKILDRTYVLTVLKKHNIHIGANESWPPYKDIKGTLGKDATPGFKTAYEFFRKEANSELTAGYVYLKRFPDIKGPNIKNSVKDGKGGTEGRLNGENGSKAKDPFGRLSTKGEPVISEDVTISMSRDRDIEEVNEKLGKAVERFYGKNPAELLKPGHLEDNTTGRSASGNIVNDTKPQAY